MVIPICLNTLLDDFCESWRFAAERAKKLAFAMTFAIN